ncbi:putative monodehydroascorbate reductase (NADH) [Helianthus annuus]|uniref:Putative thioredoxin n=2 Tax=Helianthus annuus TaxID=4232 RepID=A0A251U529_HELAN|nr:putative monodehydroascorbate reductase (NADH) [Helianthus annuus]KAJ0442633.1 putative monodehydroascorbate reductase (NADH) [Helianthus annuus]KAJ0460351.1 putative monodehydroascorbate reductase (NADH) [Helianthus annuus]KAJ0640793.1 putative monodehydroascorbate reductase (NADH) [Helianthus annuus]KAJ0644703.1 putative monodehydroascorbate reductase (NADH) [Helianthus annuus]
MATTHKFSTQITHISPPSNQPNPRVTPSFHTRYHIITYQPSNIQNTLTHNRLPPTTTTTTTTMALQIHHVCRPISPPSPSPPPSLSPSSWPTKQSNIVGEVRRSFNLVKTTSSKTANKLRNLTVRSSLEASGTAVVVGVVTEVDKDTFWPIVNAAGDKTVVLDMYTQWCGPCKIIAPRFQELAEKNLDVVFLKLDCNQENKPLAKELGIKVVPTFKILKHGKIVKEVTGAKFDNLVAAMEEVRSS